MSKLIDDEFKASAQDSPAAITSGKESNYGWIVIGAGFLCVAVLYGAYYSFGVFITEMTGDLGWSRAVITASVGVYALTHGIFAIIMGRLTDKYKPQYIIAGGALLVGLGYMITSQISSPWHLYICFGLLVGVGMGAAYVPPTAIVTRWFTTRRGLALGVVAAGVGVGQMIFPPLMTYLIDDFGWRTAFVVMGIIANVVGIPAALLLRNPKTSNDTPAESNDAVHAGLQEDWTTREAMKTLPFVLLLLVFSGLVFAVGSVTVHLVVHIQDIGFDPEPAALALTLIGGFGIVGRIMSGWAADKIGNRTILGFCLALLACLLFSLIAADDLWEIYVIAALFGFGYGSILPVIIKMISEFFGVVSVGAIFGILFFGATVGGAIGAPLAGHISDVTGSYSLAFTIAGIVLILTFFASLGLKAPKHSV